MWCTFCHHVNTNGTNLDEEAKVYARAANKDDEQTIKMFKLYWYTYSNRYKIDYIKKQMKLTNNEYNSLNVLLLLNRGVSPNDIVKQTGVKKDIIEKISGTVYLKGG